jgi:hypothetical protein
MFARKMGVERCMLVQPSGSRGRPVAAAGAIAPPKDANEVLVSMPLPCSSLSAFHSIITHISS